MQLPFSLPSSPYKWIGVGIAALVAVAAVFFSIKAYGNARYDAGQTDERVIWEKVVADDKLRLAELQRKADAALTAQRSNDWAKIEQSRKELEDVLTQIPDQTTSARQRTRACVELRRQGQEPASCLNFPSP